MQFLMAIFRISSIYLFREPLPTPSTTLLGGLLRPESPTLELNFSLWFAAPVPPLPWAPWYQKNVFYRTALSASFGAASPPSSFQSKSMRTLRKLSVLGIDDFVVE